MKFKLSKYLVVSDVLDPANPRQERILFTTRTGISSLVSDEFYNTLQKGDFDAIDNNQLSRLMDYEILVEEDEDEFQEIIKMNRLGVKDSKTIAMTIQPSANCQFGCFYCGQVHSKNTMTEDIQEKVLERVKNIMARKEETEGIDVTWYGGEPLMGYNVINSLSSRLQQLATENGIRYSASMITNGLSLKPDVFTNLYLNHKVQRFQITLDTMKEHHDIRRITKTGESTFDIIMKNIMEITALPHYKQITNRPIFIRMNIDLTNYKRVTDFIDYLADLGLTDKVEVGFSPLTNWGDKTAGDEQALSVQEFAELEIEWLMYTRRKGFGVDYVLPKRHYDVCMVVNEDNEVYDALGNITPCYEFPYTPRYEGEKYVIGNLLKEEDTYNNRTQVRGWYDDLASCQVSPKCSKCNLFPVCNGGCPKNWYNDEITCPTMKLNIEDKLVLQYLMDKTNLQTL